MTTKDDSFNASDIDYLESRLINIAEKAGKLDRDNKKKGNPQKVDEFRQAELEQYLEEALFLLELIGIRVFKMETRKMRRSNCNARERLREYNDVLRKYADETYHIENDYLYSLDVRNFNIVPENYCVEAERFVRNEMAKYDFEDEDNSELH